MITVLYVYVKRLGVIGLGEMGFDDMMLTSGWEAEGSSPHIYITRNRRCNKREHN